MTGATGNVGGAVLRALEGRGAEVHGSGHQTEAPVSLRARPWRSLDLETGRGVALGAEYDAVFLMRPPQLADASRFQPMLDQTARTTRIVFLSVQGAGTRSYLPHAKIEALIRASGHPHVFVRPGYFMENLLTTLAPELRARARIFLPSGSLAFNWTAVDDVAAAAAELLLRGGPDAVELTGPEALGFEQVAAILNRKAGLAVRYEAAGLVPFIAHRRREGDAWGYIAVLLLLHWWPKVSGNEPLNDRFREVTNREPEPLALWVERHRTEFRAP